MLKLKWHRVALGMIVLLFCRPGFPLSPIPRYAQVTVHVLRYEGGAFVVEKLKEANAHAGLSCLDVATSTGTFFVSKGFIVNCGYGYVPWVRNSAADVLARRCPRRGLTSADLGTMLSRAWRIQSHSCRTLRYLVGI
jgi:hypothetical protein